MLQLQRQQLEGVLARQVSNHQDACAQRTRAAVHENELLLAEKMHQELAAKEEELANYLHFKTEEDKYKTASAFIGSRYSAPLSKSKADAGVSSAGRVAKVRDLKVKVEALDVSLSSLDTMKGGMHVHALAATALAHGPASNDVKQLDLSTGSSTRLASQAIQAVPGAKSAPPSLAELQTRFKAVHHAGRCAAMVPEGMTGAEGRFIGMLLATFLVSSSSPPPAAAGGAEVTLATAAKLVDRGDLPAAVRELRDLTGQPQQAVGGWMADAVHHLIHEQASSAVNSKMILHR